MKQKIAVIKIQIVQKRILALIRAQMMKGLIKDLSNALIMDLKIPQIRDLINAPTRDLKNPLTRNLTNAPIMDLIRKGLMMKNLSRDRVTSLSPAKKIVRMVKILNLIAKRRSASKSRCPINVARIVLQRNLNALLQRKVQRIQMNAHHIVMQSSKENKAANN